MAKPGMDRGGGPLRPGLLSRFGRILALLMVLPWEGLCPQSPLILSVEASPANPEPGFPWTVLILLDHSEPAQVMINMPDLPASLSLERLRVEPRLMEAPPASGGQARFFRYTQVELQFIPRQGGPILLKPLEISVPGRREFTRELRAFAGDFSMPWGVRLFWEGIPQSLMLGEAAEIRLVMRPPGGSAAPPRFRADAPQGALLEELPPGEAAQSRGLLLHLRVIPLEGPELYFASQTLPWGKVNLEIPGWRIPVLSPPKAPEAPRQVLEEPRPRAQAFPPFPPWPGVFQKEGLRRIGNWGSEKTAAEARRYWEGGSPAEALAHLRGWERYSLGGPGLTFLRQAAEEALGLGVTEDEPWRPRFLGFALIAGSLIPAIAAFLVYMLYRGKKAVTSSAPGGYRVIVLWTLILLGTGIWLWALGKTGTRGVLRETGVYPVPVIQGKPGFQLPEGTPVRIISQTSAAAAWVYVESFDGKAGWVPLDRVLSY